MKRSQRQEAKIAVTHTLTMRMRPIIAIQWIENEYGIKISERSYHRLRREIDSEKEKVLFSVARNGLVNQHIQRLKNLDFVEATLWELYRISKKTMT